MTTLLTENSINVFGTGPIRGFATTLVIGILTSSLLPYSLPDLFLSKT